MNDRKQHWEAIYADREPSQLTWHQNCPELSLQLIAATGISPEGRIIDVGGGTSRLVDHLLTAGYTAITVLDISGNAMQQSRLRLGDRAKKVSWLEADITSAQLPESHFDVWHDRAVFHFLTDPDDRRKYLKAIERALRPGGHIILATFAVDGPERCSGLDVVRYGAQDIAGLFSSPYELAHTVDEAHVTPWNTTQKFTYFQLIRR